MATVRNQGKLTCNVSNQAIQSNGKGLIVVAFVATAYCCIFAIPSWLLPFFSQLIVAPFLLPVAIVAFATASWLLPSCHCLTCTKNSRHYNLAKAFWLIQIVFCALKIWYNWISNLCIEVLPFSTFFQKGGKFTGVVYAVITKSKPKRRRRRYPVVVAADYRHLVIPRVVALFWHGQIIEQSIFLIAKVVWIHA